MSIETVLQEADRIVSNDRGNDYGHPLDDFKKTAALWSVILGVKVDPKQVPLCMIAVKISREMNHHKRDNLVDIAGYAKTLDMVHERLQSVAKPREVINEGARKVIKETVTPVPDFIMS